MNVVYVAFQGFFAIVAVLICCYLRRIALGSKASSDGHASFMGFLAARDQEDRRWTDGEWAFVKASQGVSMIPWDFSATLTWLISDFVPGGHRRGVKPLDRIYDSVQRFEESEGVTISGSARPFGEYHAPDGEILYEGVEVCHSPRRRK